MKTLILTFSLVVLLTNSALAQESNLRTQYNHIEDRSSVVLKSDSVKGAELYAGFYFNYHGKALKKPVTAIGLVIDSSSRKWKYLRAGSLRLYVLAGEERFHVDGARFDSDVQAGRESAIVTELLTVFVDRRATTNHR